MLAEWMSVSIVSSWSASEISNFNTAHFYIQYCTLFNQHYTKCAMLHTKIGPVYPGMISWIPRVGVCMAFLQARICSMLIHIDTYPYPHLYVFRKYWSEFHFFFSFCKAYPTFTASRIIVQSLSRLESPSCYLWTFGSRHGWALQHCLQQYL